MKAELEAQIARLEKELADAKAKLQELMIEVPQEFHSLTRDMFERIKAFFE